MFLAFISKVTRGREEILRARGQALLPLSGHAVWDGCQLEGSVAAVAVATLGTATRADVVFSWDYSCRHVSSIKLCLPAGCCQLLAAAGILNCITRWLLKCWEDLKKAMLLHTVLPSMALVLETELDAKMSVWSSLAYTQMWCSRSSMIFSHPM